MKNKKILIVVAIALVAVFIFLDGTITGNFAKRVSYDDLCRSDADCREGRTCCVIYEGYGLCEFENYCQSIEFLCKDDNDCEEGTVCCISDGMIHGICNYEDRCMSIELFGDYVSKVKPKVDGPMQLSPKYSNIKTIIIAVLLIIVIWLLWKNNQIKKNIKR